jgi:hypothetical protein
MTKVDYLYLLWEFTIVNNQIRDQTLLSYNYTAIIMILSRYRYHPVTVFGPPLPTVTERYQR